MEIQIALAIYRFAFSKFVNRLNKFDNHDTGWRKSNNSYCMGALTISQHSDWALFICMCVGARVCVSLCCEKWNIGNSVRGSYLSPFAVWQLSSCIRLSAQSPFQFDAWNAIHTQIERGRWREKTSSIIQNGSNNTGEQNVMRIFEVPSWNSWA